tara:strand:+ start:91072 stop:92418 length:1347 start_codon:yes stop_codon:yes gene_type:complete
MSFDREQALLLMRELTKEAMYGGKGAPGAQLPPVAEGQNTPPNWAMSMDQKAQGTSQSNMGVRLNFNRASKSTAAMHRNQGSVIRSAERQKPKKNTGGLVGRADNIVAQEKISVASVLSKREAKARLVELLRSSDSTKEAWIRKEAAGGLILRGLQAAKNFGSRLFSGAARTATKPKPKQLSFDFGGAASRTRPSGPYANLPSASHVTSTGRGTSQAAGMGSRLREGASKTKHYLSHKGSGFKNVYKRKGSDELFTSYRPTMLRPKNWEVVRKAHQTGGAVQRAVKGIAGGAVKGGLGAYGLSWALNRDAAWDDPKRLNMALGGAVLWPSMFSGGPAALAMMGGMAGSEKLRGAAGGFTPAVGALWNSRNWKDGAPSKTQSTMANLTEATTRYDPKETKKEIDMLNRRAAEAEKKWLAEQGRKKRGETSGDRAAAQTQAKQDKLLQKN